MFEPGPLTTIPSSRETAGFPGERSRRGRGVFSFVGVLGITLVLFFVVAVTARAMLGR